MSFGHSYGWVGGTGAAWTAASAWDDLTLGALAVTAPGSLDSASIIGGLTPVVVTGSGAAGAVATHLSVLLDGAFQFGTVNVEGTLTLAGGGSRLAASTLVDTGAVASSIVVSATTLSVSGASALGSVTVTGGGWASLGLSATISAGATVDGSSCVEVGTGGTFWSGWVKVYTDGTLSGSGAIAANTVVTGTILSSGMRFQGFLGGVGQVRLDASGATVGTVFAGTHLVFAAQGAVLGVTSAAAMAGTLVGFRAGDAIDLLGQAAVSATYVATDAQDGVLTVTDASGGTFGRFVVAGAASGYAASVFMIVPDGAGGTLVVDLPAAASGPVSPGNTTSHRAAWAGGSGGAWNAAANWRDLTLAATAVVAPGSLDSASIIGGLTPVVVTGSGAAGAVATHLSVLLDGAFQFGTVNVEGTLTLAGGGSRLAASTLVETGAVASSIVVSATTLTVSGTSAVGSITVTGGGWASLGLSATISAGATVDGSSCVEVGTGGTFWSGWVKVYTDGTLSGSGAIAANTVVTGTILSSGMRFQGFLGGVGQVRLDASGATVGTVFAGTHLVFAAQGAVLGVTSAAAMAGTLVGFRAGDAIDLLGQAAVSASYTTTDPKNGVLSVAGPGGASLGKFLLAGGSASYAASNFGVLPDGAGGSLIVTHPS